jgi:DNA-directed RNA polymerase specialized sigma24 family protein
MADAKNEKALRAVQAAQAKFEREQGKAHEARRKAFAKAQKEGLSLRQIGEGVGLHHTRVSQIIRGTN